MSLELILFPLIQEIKGFAGLFEFLEKFMAELTDLARISSNLVRYLLYRILVDDDSHHVSLDFIIDLFVFGFELEHADILGDEIQKVLEDYVADRVSFL